MTVALLSLECYLPMSQSLKDKRMVLRRLKDRLKASNVAVAEVAYQDLWQRAGLAVGSFRDLAWTAVTGLALVGLWQTGLRPLLRPLVPAGRVTLTLYIGQSLIFVPVYYGFGLGWQAVEVAGRRPRSEEAAQPSLSRCRRWTADRSANILPP